MKPDLGENLQAQLLGALQGSARELVELAVLRPVEPRIDLGRKVELADRRQRGPREPLRYVDGVLLVDPWGELVLPARVRAAWQPVIEAALAAGLEPVAS